MKKFLHTLFRNAFAGIALSILLLNTLITAETDTIFYTPDIVKDNVVFWKKIYAEVSITEGLLHDREYPLVIYQKLSGGSSRPKSTTIKKHRAKIVDLLKGMDEPESKWTKEQKAIGELFKKHASIDALKGAEDRVRFQQGQMERFKEGLIRSGMYLDTIRSILREYNIPEQLIYMPHVESSFNTLAYSKAGAAGMWQFMRGTGRLYGMQIDYTIDERRNPILSTIAAAKYLSNSYKELKSWPLAITSYNHGLYGVKRAVKNTGSSDIGVIIQKYESRSFRFASKNFYSCFIAALDIAQNYENYFPNVELFPRFHFNNITLDHYVRPRILAEYLAVPEEELIALNPAIRPIVFEHQKLLPKGFSIHIPPTISPDSARLALARIPDSLKSDEPERPKYYRVNRGDNLNTIASRLGVTVRDIALENNITRINRIYPGQVLRIPDANIVIVAKKGKSPPPTRTEPVPVVAPTKKVKQIAIDSVKNEAVAEMAAAEAKQLISEENDDEDSLETQTVVDTIAEDTASSPALVSSEQTSDSSETKNTSDGEPADTFTSIAMVPAVEPKIISPSKIRSTVAPDFDVSIYNLDATLSPVGNAAEIVVSVDETIGHYADWLKVGTWQIRKLNDMGKESSIKVNHRIQIPIISNDALEGFVAARLEYHMAIEEDFYSQFKITDVKKRTIKKGETLWHICNGSDNAVPIWLFKKYNKELNLNKIAPNMTVAIPVIEEKTEEEVAATTPGSEQ